MIRCPIVNNNIKCGVNANYISPNDSRIPVTNDQDKNFYLLGSLVKKGIYQGVLLFDQITASDVNPDQAVEIPLCAHHATTDNILQLIQSLTKDTNIIISGGEFYMLGQF